MTDIPKHITTEFIAFASLYPEPSFSTKKASGKQWISYGELDDLPSYLNGLLDKSPDHAAVINGLIQFTQGNGLVKPTNAKAQAMFANGTESVIAPNDLNHVQAKLVRDLVVFGGCLVNVRMRKDRSGIADIHAVPVEKMRLDVDGDGYWICSDWSNVRKNPPEFFPDFDPTQGGSQLLYIKGPTARNTPYALPGYWSARQAIDLQSSMMKFNLKRVNNNFQVSAIISYDDTPTPEEQDLMTKSLKDYTTGPDGDFTGGFLQTFGGGVTVTPFDSGSGPKDFEWISTFADQRLRAAHRIPNSGAIFGLSRGDNPQGFSQQDLEAEFDLYNQTVVRPLQNVLISLWSMLGQVNGLGDFAWEIDPFVLGQDGSVTGAKKEGSTTVGTSSVDGAVNVAATALNGAQIDSLISIITSVSSGTLTRETALPLISAAFPTIPLSSVEAMLNGAKNADVAPTPTVIPNPNPITPDGSKADRNA